MVGAGVLALPFSLSYLTWTWGLLFLTFCTFVSLYCAHLLAELHEAPDGTRYNRYKDLGQAVLGIPIPLISGKRAALIIFINASVSIESSGDR